MATFRLLLLGQAPLCLLCSDSMFGDAAISPRVASTSPRGLPGLVRHSPTHYISACVQIFTFFLSLSSSGPSSFVLAASSNKQTQNVMNNFIYYAIFYKSVGMSALIVGATGALMTALVPVSKMPLKSFKSLYQSAGRSKSAM